MHANKTVWRLSQYEYDDAQVNVTFSGSGKHITQVRVNGELLHHTLQIPQSLLRSGANAVEVAMGEIDGSLTVPLQLVESSVQLLETTQSDNATHYSFKTMVEENVLAFRNLNEHVIALLDSTNATVPTHKSSTRLWKLRAAHGLFRGARVIRVAHLIKRFAS